MNMFRPLVILLLCWSSCASSLTADYKTGDQIAICFPALDLSNGERIVSFSLTTTGAWVRDMRNIPIDWSISLASEPTWQPEVSGGAVHGSGALFSSSEVPVIVVELQDQSYRKPFNLEGVLDTTVDFEAIKTYRYSIADLKVCGNKGLKG